MAQIGPSVAEIHVMRKLHKEKMKTTEVKTSKREMVVDEDKTCSVRCYFWVLKKVKLLLRCSKPTTWDYKGENSTS
ncbi:hypothetical protein A4A49_32032 [Nicotiana attenuata]|uniref:Uncharacterized protein n=1 Tax=Nicotiana attenuata TaxID=49451 RepID=A0A1J6JX19_NICAT|nr:hypothetical protein A4A49_32032 [Nicotiana attenuata]